MTDADEFRLKIEAYTPETMPMERLAAYLSELAEMLGEGKSVHFVRLEPGSTSIIHKIEREAVPKVRTRTNSLRRGIGPRDSVRAYRKINKMLREDNGSAVWKDEKTAADIIIFPGRDDAEEQVNGITQRSSIDGEVVRIGGMQNIVPIMLKYEQDELTGFSGCWASKSVAKDLAKRLFEPVRLFGTGKWNRNDEGIWKLDVFRVDSFEALKIDPLSVAINELRSIQGGWESSSYEELTYLRGGIEGQANGSA